MKSIWRRWILGHGDVVSPWVGLSFAFLYLGAVAGVWFAGLHVQRSQLQEQRITDARRWTGSISRYLSQLQNKELVGRTVRTIGHEEGIRFAAVVSPAGVAIAHSDPLQVGQRLAEPAWREVAEGAERVGDAADAGVVISSRIRMADGDVSSAQLWVGLAPSRTAWRQSDLILWSGYILAAVMGLYLILYRILRRSVQPLAVIRKRLLRSGDDITQNLLALRLNDSFDQVSTSWNRLIEFVAQMQEQLRKSRLSADVTGAMDGYRSERLTGILMQIPFGVLVVDGTGRISFANRAAAGLLGTAGDGIEGTEIAQLLDEPTRLSVLSTAASGRGSALGGGRWTDHTLNRPHGDVTLRFWSTSGESGEHVVFLQDVTQAKEAEQARDQFLYHVTHELRTPLTNIRAYAETLSEGVIDDEQTVRECYNVIMGETQRLNRLVEDILNVSQLEVGSARLDLGEVQLERLLRTVVQDSQGKADARNIDLMLNLPAKMPQVRGDKERLSVVLTNLVGNALKYTPEGGHVDVRCAVESGRVRISVADTGIGIRKEDQDKIFEKFYRVNDERVGAIPGTGLGLAIVKETVRLHGGSVFVESTPEKGSTFIVTLPAAELDVSGKTGLQPGPGETR